MAKKVKIYAILRGPMGVLNDVEVSSNNEDDAWTIFRKIYENQPGILSGTRITFQSQPYYYAKDGTHISSKEIYYISYLNKENNFRQTDKEFTGENAFQKAIKWGRANLDNFNSDMIRMKDAAQGIMLGKVEPEVNFIKAMEESGVMAQNSYKNKVVISTIKSIVSMSKKEFSSYIKENPNPKIEMIYSEYKDWIQTAKHNEAANGKEIKTSYSPEALKFIGKVQLSITKTNPEFEDARIKLNELVSKMPKTYETDGIKVDDKIAYLHYFKSSTDIYIVEKDMEDEQKQAFGYSILNGDTQNAELGYIDIDEVKEILELDLYWTPTKIGKIKQKGLDYMKFFPKASNGSEISGYKKQLTEALYKKFSVDIKDTGFDDTHIKLAMGKKESISDVVESIGNAYKLTPILNNNLSYSKTNSKTDKTINYICVIKDSSGNEIGSYPVSYTDDKYIDEFLKTIGVKLKATDTREIVEKTEVDEDV